MTVNAPNPGNYFSGLTQTITTLRDVMEDLVNANNYLNAMGGAAFLEAAPFSLSNVDAQMVIATLGNLANLSGIANGTATQQTEFNFIAASQQLWGGQ